MDVHPDQADRGERSVDDEFLSLMDGLRTSLPGVQVLFAFLLTAPLQAGFSDLTQSQRTAFAIAFYSAGLASVLLIAPSVHQRVRAPQTGISRNSKRHLIWTTWLTIVGSGVMGVAVLATVYLVSDLVFSSWSAVVATMTLAAVLCWAWMYLPLVTFNRRR